MMQYISMKFSKLKPPSLNLISWSLRWGLHYIKIDDIVTRNVNLLQYRIYHAFKRMYLVIGEESCVLIYRFLFLYVRCTQFDEKQYLLHLLCLGMLFQITLLLNLSFLRIFHIVFKRKNYCLKCYVIRLNF